MMRSALATSLIITLTLGSTPAFADPKPATPAASAHGGAVPLDKSLTGEARAEYDSALVLYEDGDFANASLKFQRAYSLSHDARLLWNAAAAEKQLRHYPRMYSLVSRYLKEAGDTLTATEKADATSLLQTVENFVSHVTIHATPPDVELFIDDISIAKLPTAEPILADMGPRRFRIHKEGMKDFVVEREVIGGTPLTIDAKLEQDLKVGTLRVTAAQGDTIRIDGRPVGSGEWQGSLATGVHSLSVTGEGKKPYQTDVAVESGQLVTHRVTLERNAAAAHSQFVSWPWVAGGVAAVALLGVGAYFAFKPGDPPPATAAPGTIAPGYWTLGY